MLKSGWRTGGLIFAVVALGGAGAALFLLPGPLQSAERHFEAYIAEHGQDLDACFGELPEMNDERLDLGMVESEAPPPASVPMRRVVLALDASGSMAGRIGGRTKMDIARDAALDFVSTLDDDVELGLVLFGHTGTNQESGRAESCSGVELTRSIQRGDRAALTRELQAASATGWTPLAAAIELAGESFEASEVAGEQVVYVISDGEETCHGDPVAAARQLAESDVRAVVNIIGFDLPRDERDALRAVAEAGNGVFWEAADADALQAGLSQAAHNSLMNSGALAQTLHHTRGGKASNALSTSGMLGQTSLCLSAGTGQESLSLAEWSIEHGLEPETVEEIRALLAVRADRYQARYDELEAEAERRRAAADAILQDDLDRATERYEDTLDDG